MKQKLLNYRKTWKFILNKHLHIIKHHCQWPVFSFSLFKFREAQYLWMYAEFQHRGVCVWTSHCLLTAAMSEGFGVLRS